MAPTALHVSIEGMVQGVGFRQAMVRQARALGLTGWVRNLPDGRVEAWFEGAPADLETVLEWCGHGPALAIVRGIESSQQLGTGSYPTFEIRF